MADNRISSSQGKETVCIDTYRVLDSCRDKDYFEDTKVFLTCEGQNIIDQTCNLRVKSTDVVAAFIDIQNVPFNRGFYQLDTKIYVKLIIEACICPGNLQQFEGLAILEKKVILFGSEGNVSVFKNDRASGGFCSGMESCVCSTSTNLPMAVIETVDPLVLDIKVVDSRCCNCKCSYKLCDIPSCVANMFDSEFIDGEGNNKLLVSLGLFSVIRIQRPAQYLVNACEYNVPKKECHMPLQDDPYELFKSMNFPTDEFSSPSAGCLNEKNTSCRTDTNKISSCGCS